MVADAFPAEQGDLTRLVRTGVRDKVYDKVLAFDPMLDLEWSVGRHSCMIHNGAAAKTGARLLHYRYFGEEWLKERNARNHARKSERDIRNDYGYHVRPDYTEGRYSLDWYKHAMTQAQDVTYG